MRQEGTSAQQCATRNNTESCITKNVTLSPNVNPLDSRQLSPNVSTLDSCIFFKKKKKFHVSCVQKWAENDAHQPEHVWERDTRATFGTRVDNNCSRHLRERVVTLDKVEGRYCIKFQTTLLKLCMEVQTDVVNCRLLQHPLLCKALSNCLHSSRSK